MKSLLNIQNDPDLKILNQKNPGLYDVLKELQDTVVAQGAAINALTLRVEALENAS